MIRIARSLWQTFNHRVRILKEPQAGSMCKEMILGHAIRKQYMKVKGKVLQEAWMNTYSTQGQGMDFSEFMQVRSKSILKLWKEKISRLVLWTWRLSSKGKEEGLIKPTNGEDFANRHIFPGLACAAHKSTLQEKKRNQDLKCCIKKQKLPKEELAKVRDCISASHSWFSLLSLLIWVLICCSKLCGC